MYRRCSDEYTDVIGLYHGRPINNFVRVFFTIRAHLSQPETRNLYRSTHGKKEFINSHSQMSSGEIMPIKYSINIIKSNLVISYKNQTGLFLRKFSQIILALYREFYSNKNWTENDNKYK